MHPCIPSSHHFSHFPHSHPSTRTLTRTFRSLHTQPKAMPTAQPPSQPVSKQPRDGVCTAGTLHGLQSCTLITETRFRVAQLAAGKFTAYSTSYIHTVGLP